MDVGESQKINITTRRKKYHNPRAVKMDVGESQKNKYHNPRAVKMDVGESQKNRYLHSRKRRQ